MYRSNLLVYDRRALSRRSSSTYSLLLDPVIKSETVEVQYMLEGKFGGFGGFVEKQSGLHEVRISTSVGNIPADAIKLVMWFHLGAEWRHSQFTLRNRSQLKGPTRVFRFQM